jgi:hypothetical protein
VDGLDLFEGFGYRLFDKVVYMSYEINRIYAIKLKIEHASEALFDYQSCSTERDQLIQFFVNQDDYSGFIFFEVSENGKINFCVKFEANS